MKTFRPFIGALLLLVAYSEISEARLTGDDGIRVRRSDNNDEAASSSSATNDAYDIMKYALKYANVNCDGKSLFKKKSVEDIFRFSKNEISEPMLIYTDKGPADQNCDACKLFELVQVFMGDRTGDGRTKEQVAAEIVNTAYAKPDLRNELYFQICRQTRENSIPSSLENGWKLMAVCLAYVPPSDDFEPYLQSYVDQHIGNSKISHIAKAASERLQKIGARGLRVPRGQANEAEIHFSMKFQPSVFGASLEEMMELQKERFPDRKLPWSLTTLTQNILLRGTTKGIFGERVNLEALPALQWSIDNFDEGALLASSQNPHELAALLKLWFQELYRRVIPAPFSNGCLEFVDYDVPPAWLVKYLDIMPPLYRRVLYHLIHFLQIVTKPVYVEATGMDAQKLAKIFGPIILPGRSYNYPISIEDDPAAAELVYILIRTLDTSWDDGLE